MYLTKWHMPLLGPVKDPGWLALFVKFLQEIIIDYIDGSFKYWLWCRAVQIVVTSQYWHEYYDIWCHLELNSYSVSKYFRSVPKTEKKTTISMNSDTKNYTNIWADKKLFEQNY